MRRALVTSAIVHGAIAAAVTMWMVAREVRPAPTRSMTVELVDVIEPAPSTSPVPAASPGDTPAAAGAGGSSAARASALAPVSPTARRSLRPPRSRHDRVSDLVALAIERDEGGVGAIVVGAGRITPGAGGDGGGRGTGLGLGAGGPVPRMATQLPVPAAPVAAPPSRARAATLIYPKRRGDLGADRLFIARITVDTDGYVTGARMVRGGQGPRDADAAALIFRFRYAPALDDEGRAIETTFEQPFHVNR